MAGAGDLPSGAVNQEAWREQSALAVEGADGVMDLGERGDG
jgi:hypothetical protein